MSTMKLFIDSNYLSPYAMSAYVALREKSIPFEVALVNLQSAEHQAASYACISNTQRVPARVKVVVVSFMQPAAIYPQPAS